jgi:hypothetical protein
MPRKGQSEVKIVYALRSIPKYLSMVVSDELAFVGLFAGAR